VSSPIGYLLTVRTFGTWLHGDERGSHNRSHRTYGTPALPSRPGLQAVERSRMRGQPRLLDARSRAVVERVASEVCEYRGWDLLAVHARTNHVHLVVAARCAPEDVVRSIKSWTTRRLVQAGQLPAATPLWSRHASTVYLWTQASRNRAVHYVLFGQDGDAKTEGP
jgi:REP element-mobilizing transposase RayT